MFYISYKEAYEEDCICDIEEGLSYIDVERWDDICDNDNEFKEYLKVEYATR